MIFKTAWPKIVEILNSCIYEIAEFQRARRVKHTPHAVPDKGKTGGI